MQTKPTTPTKILVVDDDEGVRGVTAAILLSRGYTVVMAAGGQEALALLQTHDISFLLTDLQMPGMDGCELIQEARAIYPRMPALIMTGLMLDSARLQHIRHRVIRKPFTTRALLAAIEEVTEKATDEYDSDRSDPQQSVELRE
jgi:CheY-like chemotaxis protein